jgi:GAF domain-containing protein
MAKKTSPVNNTIKKKSSNASGVNAQRPAIKTPSKKHTNAPVERTGQPSTKKSIALKHQLAQREAELAILNSVGEAMAKTLDVKTIAKIVGDKIQSIFAAEGVTIRLYDRASNLIQRAYDYDLGYQDLTKTSFPMGQGLTSRIIETGLPLRLGTSREQDEAGASKIPTRNAPEEEMQSYMGVPIVVGDQVIGAVAVHSYKQHAYNDDHIRLLQTLAANMGVAIQNARLFEAEQERVAELQIINSIQQGLAAELDFQAIVDLVGDKLSEVLHTGELGIRWYDEKTNLIHHLYEFEHGERLQIPPLQPKQGGVFETMTRTRQPVVMRDEEDYKKWNLPIQPGTDQSKSAVYIPIISSDRVLGFITIENYERENAFGESELRLLTTIAASLGTALENARLFDETQRLLNETEQRASELAIINSIGQTLTEELDLMVMIERVGDQVRKALQVKNIGIGIYNEKENIMQAPYVYRDGQRLNLEPFALNAFNRRASKLGRSLVVNKDAQKLWLKFGAISAPNDIPQSFVMVPLMAGKEMVGGISLQDFENENAFTDLSIGLLETIASNMGTAILNARLFKAEQERVAELQIINSIQQGLAAELSFQGIMDLVGDKLRDVLNTSDLTIGWYDEKANLIHYFYTYEHGERLNISTRPPRPGGILLTILKTRQPLVFNTIADFEKVNALAAPGTDQSKSAVAVPIINSDRVLGLITTESFEREYAYGESELRLLTTIAASLGTALENARLFDETQQRNAELAIINAVQRALAAELDIRGIYYAVGEKLREIFDAQTISIYSASFKRRMTTVEYSFEKGQRFDSIRVPFNSLHESIIESDEILLRNGDFPQYASQFKDYKVPAGEIPLSVMSTTVYRNKEADIWVGVSIQDMDGQRTFGDSDVRLLETVAGAMRVAFQNAQSFKAEQERVAELQIINSIQQGLAAELDFQAIVDLVGDRLREVFHTHNLSIRWYDRRTNQIHYLYVYEHAQRLNLSPRSLQQDVVFERLTKTHQPLVWRNRDEGDAISPALPGTEDSKSGVNIPILSSDRVLGSIGVENFEREDAYGEPELRLLTTIAASLGTALENARLFDETQRLLKETEQRNAELAIINSVQKGLASKLEIRAIYELIGEKVRQIFNADTTYINTYDSEQQAVYSQYYVDKGQRIVRTDPLPFGEGLYTRVIQTRQSILAGTRQEQLELGVTSASSPDSERDLNQSYLGVPILLNDQVTGVVSVQSYAQNAFGENDLRLLQTLANSMSVALENARLFNETQRLLKETEQRAAELAIINSVQEGLAAKLEYQGIIDLVGDKIREIFDAHAINITEYDAEADLFSSLYTMERGIRRPFEPMPAGPLFRHIINTRESLRFNTVEELNNFGAITVPGTEFSMSGIYVPLFQGSKLLGIIALENLDHENAFTESDLRLLTTLANSMSVALENARLFDETQRLLKETEERNAELAIINSVQEGLARKLDFQGIVELIGEKVREIFGADTVSVGMYDSQHDRIHHTYYVDRGQRVLLTEGPAPRPSLTAVVVDQRAPLLISTQEEMRSYGALSIAPSENEEDQNESFLSVPILTSEDIIGTISVQSYQKQAFNNEDVRLLQTLANSMSIALENARLFDETQRLLKETEQRAAELATINTVSNALAGELNLEALIELVGEQIRRTFKADIAYVALLQEETDTINFSYTHGEELTPMLYGQGLTSKIIETGKPLLINQDLDKRRQELGATQIGNQARSYLGVPIFVAGRAIGVISVQSAEQENVFTENDQRLLETIAANVGVALQNARFFDEIQTRNREITESLEQQTATGEILQVIASSPTDIQPVLNVIAQNAAQLSGSADALIDIAEDGLLRVAAHYGAIPMFPVGESIPLNRDSVAGRALLEGRTLQAVHHQPGEESQYPEGDHWARHYGYKMTCSVPLLREGKAIGAITIRRREEELLTKQQIALIETFASQAVIAIENVRLFNELQTRNREVTESLEYQTATSDILSIIAENPTDIQPVLDAVAERAARLCNSYDAVITRTDGDKYRITAHWGPVPLPMENLLQGIPLNRDSVTGEAMVDKRTVHIRDLLAEPPDKYLLSKKYYLTSEQRTILVTPLIRENEVIGSIMIRRQEVNPFTEKQVGLLKTGRPGGYCD